MMKHVFSVKAISLKDKNDENVCEVKLEMNVNSNEDLDFIFELVRMKQLPFVEIAFSSPQKTLLEAKRDQAVN